MPLVDPMKRRRAPKIFLSNEQKETLVDMIGANYGALFGNFTDSAMKAQLWQEISRTVNAAGPAKLDVVKMKHRWEVLKSSVKTRLYGAGRQNNRVTTPPAVNPVYLSELEERVAELLKNSADVLASAGGEAGLLSITGGSNGLEIGDQDGESSASGGHLTVTPDDNEVQETDAEEVMYGGATAMAIGHVKLEPNEQFTGASESDTDLEHPLPVSSAEPEIHGQGGHRTAAEDQNGLYGHNADTDPDSNSRPVSTNAAQQHSLAANSGSDGSIMIGARPASRKRVANCQLERLLTSGTSGPRVFESGQGHDRASEVGVRSGYVSRDGMSESRDTGSFDPEIQVTTEAAVSGIHDAEGPRATFSASNDADMPIVSAVAGSARDENRFLGAYQKRSRIFEPCDTSQDQSRLAAVYRNSGRFDQKSGFRQSHDPAWSSRSHFSDFPANDSTARAISNGYPDPSNSNFHGSAVESSGPRFETRSVGNELQIKLLAPDPHQQPAVRNATNQYEATSHGPSYSSKFEIDRELLEIKRRRVAIEQEKLDLEQTDKRQRLQLEKERVDIEREKLNVLKHGVELLKQLLEKKVTNS